MNIYSPSTTRSSILLASGSRFGGIFETPSSNNLKQIAMAAGTPIQKSVPLWCADHTSSAQYTPVGQVLFPDGTFIGLTLEATGRVQSFTLRLVERLRMDMALLIIAFITWLVRSIRPA